ncbi:hypothetical protein [Haloechinothrix halophila]|uniref:hypothetical protein n=1 Tax=Haloechinothrix halophila TaxID=1069073 RepID=UPI0004197A72|nr:hypothetical protein [Haloechinothrix halophila]
MAPAETTTQTLAERVILMHQGGWDEIVLVLGPLIIIGVLIVVARKQAPPDDEDEDQDDVQGDADAGTRREGREKPGE